MALTNVTVLEVADGVSLSRNGRDWTVSISHQRTRCGRYTLALLDAFSDPTAFGQGIDAVAAHLPAMPAWVELVAHAKALHLLGILTEPGGAGVVVRSHATRFDSGRVHTTMLNDEARTGAFQAAIRQAVKPGDVVVDVGTGTGILAITAALAGARHVYALEATPMSRAAQRMVDANGLSDRITIIGAHSFDVSLPEKADVLVSEIIGDDPLGEQILPTFVDARRRLLAKGAKVIPASLQVQLLPVEMPAEELERFRFSPRQAGRWRELYGIDFDALVASAGEYDHRAHINTYETRTWKRMAEPIVVADIDLLRSEVGVIAQDVEFRTTGAGAVSAIVIFFSADLGAGVRLSIHPDEATPENSWGSVLQLFAEPLDVASGEHLRVRYSFDDGGSRVSLFR